MKQRLGKWLLVGIMWGASTSFVAVAAPHQPSLVQKAAAEVKDEKAVIIDVREAEEVKDGMAEPAIWLPTSEIKSQSKQYQSVMKGLPKDKTIYVYCSAGGRAGQFVKTLRSEGYKAENLQGFDDWKDKGLPVKKPTIPSKR